MATSSDPPHDKTTDDFGQQLQEEYGGDKDPNTSINYFMILLGKPVSKLLEANTTSDPPAITEKEFSEMLKRIRHADSIWNFTEKGWKAQKLLIFKYDEHSNYDERSREEDINKEMREDLKKNLKKKLNGLNDAGIILMRACLYKQKPEINYCTTEVGLILKSQYKCSAGNTPIDYFYLIIQDESGSELLDKAVLEILKDLPGKWKQMSEQHWPGLFFGHYPKEPFMTEREREWSLNKNVRQPLIRKLRDQRGISEAHIIITRACVYTAEEQHPESIPAEKQFPECMPVPIAK